MSAPLIPYYGLNQDWSPALSSLSFPPPPSGYAWFGTGDVGLFYDPWQSWNMVGIALPPNSDSAPNSNAQNVRGGFDEPGYTYVFPMETCKLHVINSRTPPWQNDGGYHLDCYNVPCNITLKELLQQFGCNNAKAGSNKVYELTQGGNGRWYKGLTFAGENGGAMGKTLKDVGWDGTRNGVDKDFVWVWFTKG